MRSLFFLQATRIHRLGGAALFLRQIWRGTLAVTVSNDGIGWFPIARCPRYVEENCTGGLVLVMIQELFSRLLDCFWIGLIFLKMSRPQKRA